MEASFKLRRGISLSLRRSICGQIFYYLATKCCKSKRIHVNYICTFFFKYRYSISIVKKKTHLYLIYRRTNFSSIFGPTEFQNEILERIKWSTLRNEGQSDMVHQEQRKTIFAFRIKKNIIFEFIFFYSKFVVSCHTTWR